MTNVSETNNIFELRKEWIELAEVNRGLVDIESLTLNMQTRARGTSQEHAEFVRAEMENDVAMDPVDVFVLTSPLTGEEMNVVADGYHRVAAAQSLGRTEILARVHYGRTTAEAKLFAHAANVHGKKKSTDEDNKNYLGYVCSLDGMKERFHVGYELDLNKVQDFTQIPLRTLRRLTADYRNILKDARDEIIVASKEEGMTQSEIAGEVGITQAGVSKVLKEYNKRPVAESYEPEPTLAPATDASSLFSDDPDIETVIDSQPLPIKEPEPKDYEKRVAAAKERMNEGWETLARNAAKAEGRTKKSATQLGEEFAKVISVVTGKAGALEKADPTLQNAKNALLASSTAHNDFYILADIVIRLKTILDIENAA